MSRNRTTRRDALASAVALVLGSTCAGPLAAQPTDDEPSPIGRPFRTGGPELDVQLDLIAQRVRGQDEAGTRERDVDLLRAGIRIDARQQITRSIGARADLQFRARRASADVLDADEKSEFSVRRLYLQYEDEDERLRARLGRQGLADDMSWYIDEDVDGLRLGYDFGRTALDLSLSRDAHDDGRDDDPTNALVALQFDFDNKTSWTPWLQYRATRDNASHVDQTWLGMQGIGGLGKRWRYWLNAAIRDGERRDVSETISLGGTAIDIGATWTLPIAYEPSFTLGFARASGDAAPSTDDNAFRQSGVHSNEFRFNGELDFRYLGEVLDPELTNIAIMTVGAGVRIDKRTSLDAVYHAYRQVKADERLRGTDIEFDPLGVNDELGDGLDLIVSYDDGDALEIQAVVGLLQPGAAFADDTDDAWLVRLELEYTFEPLDR